MICFCVCARDHEWDRGTAQCRCGRILDPMTTTEHAEAVAQHEATGRRMLAANTMEPFIRLFKD
jgi:hypothetical protein